MLWSGWGCFASKAATRTVPPIIVAVKLYDMLTWLECMPDAHWPQQAGGPLQPLHPVGHGVGHAHFELVLTSLAALVDRPDVWRPCAAPQRRAVQGHLGDIPHLPQVQEQGSAQ